MGWGVEKREVKQEAFFFGKKEPKNFCSLVRALP
jgi:hypothetical protein